MREVTPSPVKAVLGPTNTGKTHLAVERMVAHSSGLMGFPLRLLAREVYDRVVKLKGPNEVALITGEEKIVPPQARWFLCTAESMPIRGKEQSELQRDFAFVAVDEAQLGADPERGHVFTDRLLNARGREETMILGSESLAPMVRSLLPKAEIVRRPRFSTLSYAGAAKLSRLPPRSAIVAFSADQVYAVAEALRRLRGGAAVVMGALSPRTRNAQVDMYQAGEVDYLVATDAIGMGLNMDVAHVAFAGLGKFDGRRRRRLTPAEMAQIAGRAGRHQRDGTFGTLNIEGEASAEFRPEEIDAIENHRFAPLDFLYWREGDPDYRSVEALIRSLERRPDRFGLRAAPEAVDLAVLKSLSSDPELGVVRGEPAVRRLWAACGLPDFRKTGPEQHGRLVARLFQFLNGGDGRIP
ncbi:MAG TPA: helicase-related protein, partial [Allosphingosinicella sp.]